MRPGQHIGWVLFRVYIRIMEKKIEATLLGLYGDYVGIQMETTIQGLGFRLLLRKLN